MGEKKIEEIRLAAESGLEKLITPPHIFPRKHAGKEPPPRKNQQIQIQIGIKIQTWLRYWLLFCCCYSYFVRVKWWMDNGWIIWGGVHDGSSNGSGFESRLRSLFVPLCFLENGTTIVGYMEFEQNRALAESGFFFYFCFRCRAAIVGLVLVVVMLHWSGIANGKTLSSISISYYECQNCSVALQFTVLNCILNDHVFGGVEVSPGWNVKEGIRGGGLVYFGKSMSSPDFSNTTGNERVWGVYLKSFTSLINCRRILFSHQHQQQQEQQHQGVLEKGHIIF